MIRPQLTADGRAVRLPIGEYIAALVDDLAIAYTEDPDQIAALLRAHAASVVALDFAECSEDATDYGRAMRAAEADGTREALLEELPADHQLDPQLAPDDAISLATRITKHAAHIRLRSTRK
ncbi:MULTISPECIES: hypothetical protein [Streptomyces]|uniref:Uncharacterized protein n=1 Tax=Streptomyces dengpaensis TaxID=2049881 RepID=A0ABM6SUG7_9ACTN|nr:MULTISPECIES: hypothetical protein [Streptomyces]AVH58414.1 hypothetical protein C4B68_24540 [Streptomyces dengpaensis]PIB06087.1 hypothetical protein B1C81_26260 [Streptomyces sp. HG99]